MGLESATYISDLNSSNPTATDPKSQGDDHIRLIKSTVKATFPNVTGAVTPTHTELNYVAGVTSAIQTQINAKAPTTSPTFTGSVTVPTPSASTHAASKGYVDGLAFSSALPAQTGNSGKYVTTNGTTASWDYAGIKQAPLGGGTLTAGLCNAIMSSGSYTLPDLTTAGSTFGLCVPSDATTVPSSVTTTDGWTIATGFSAGTTSILFPYSISTPHGVWGGVVMTPPNLGTMTGSGTLVLMGSAQLDTNLIVVMYQNGTSVYAVALNTSTGSWGSPVVVSAYNASNGYYAIYADSTTSFVCFTNHAAGASTVRAGTVSGTTITLGTAQTTGNQFLDVPVKLANGLYVFLFANSTGLQACSVSGNTVTMGTAIASGSVSNNSGAAKIARSSNTEFLLVVLLAGGGTATTRQLSARVGSISGTTITLNTASNGTNIDQSIRLLKSYSDGSSYVACVLNGAVGSTGDWYGITVSGTTATLGSVNAQVNNLVADFAESTYVYNIARPVIKYDNTTMLFGHLAAGPIAVTISGTTLTFGSSGGPATTVNFLKDTNTSTNVYAVGASAFDKLSVSGSTVSSAWQVAAVPNIIASDTLTDKAVSYGGTWYAWTIPSMSIALTPNKWCSVSTTNLIYYGPIS